jgi:hypothetical protein
MTDEHLFLYVVYDQPTDYPSKVIVRRQRISPGRLHVDPIPFIVADSLQRARDTLSLLVPGLACMERHPQDDPVIVETWV